MRIRKSPLVLSMLSSRTPADIITFLRLLFYSILAEKYAFHDIDPSILAYSIQAGHCLTYISQVLCAFRRFFSQLCRVYSFLIFCCLMTNHFQVILNFLFDFTQSARYKFPARRWHLTSVWAWKNFKLFKLLARSRRLIGDWGMEFLLTF